MVEKEHWWIYICEPGRRFYHWRIKEDPITEDPKENPINEKPKENPYHCESWRQRYQRKSTVTSGPLMTFFSLFGNGIW